MLYSIKSDDDFFLKKRRVGFVPNLVKDLRLQDNLGQEKFFEDMKKVFKPLTNRQLKKQLELFKTTLEQVN